MYLGIRKVYLAYTIKQEIILNNSLLLFIFFKLDKTNDAFSWCMLAWPGRWLYIYFKLLGIRFELKITSLEICYIWVI